MRRGATGSERTVRIDVRTNGQSLTNDPASIEYNITP